MPRIYLPFLLVGGLLFSLNALAQPQHTWEAANAAYDAQSYSEAIALYDSLHTQQWYDARLYFNLANAHLQLGQLGAAILNYDRAKRLRPRLPHLDHNSSIAENACKDIIVPFPQSYFQATWQQLYTALPAPAWSLLAIITWLALGLVVIFSIMGRITHQRWLMPTLFAAAIMLAALGYARKQYTWHSGAGVILATEIPLRVGADADSDIQITLHEGTRIQRIDQIGAWHKVRLRNGITGWLPSDSFELLFE